MNSTREPADMEEVISAQIDAIDRAQLKKDLVQDLATFLSISPNELTDVKLAFELKDFSLDTLKINNLQSVFSFYLYTPRLSEQHRFSIASTISSKDLFLSREPNEVLIRRDIAKFFPSFKHDYFDL